jgi:hypothetical protein
MKFKLCVCTYSSRTDTLTCTKLGFIMLLDHKEILKWSKLRIVLSSSLGEGVSCSSETKRSRRTTAKPKLFVSARRLQDERSQTRRLSWFRVPMKELGLGIFLPYVSSYQAYRRLGAVKTGKKCKHLSNLSAVTQRAFC